MGRDSHRSDRCPRLLRLVPAERRPRRHTGGGTAAVSIRERACGTPAAAASGAARASIRGCACGTPGTLRLLRQRLASNRKAPSSGSRNRALFDAPDGDAPFTGGRQADRESPGCRTPVSQSYGNAFRIPHPAGRLWERLCHRKWLMLFSSSKGITGKMSEPWIPPRGKPEKKAVFSPHCGDETTIYSNKALGNAEGASLKREMPQHYFLLIMCSGARMSSSFSRLRRFRASTMSSTEPPVSRASLAMDAEVS